MSGKWFTREDIVRDLTQAGSCVLDADNLGIVVADRPPPPLRFNDDAEEAMQREYYGMSATDNGVDEYYEPPDIASIQQMLRLVHEIDENNDEESRRHWAQKLEKSAEKQKLTKRKSEPASMGEMLLISKLNPDVPQFVPRSVKKKLTSGTEIDELPTTIKEKTSNETRPSDGHKSHINYERVIPFQDMCPEELNKIKIELKNKIKNVTEADSHKNKRSRNLAIATLLKLMSSSSKPSTPTQSLCDSPKLVTSPSRSKNNVNNETSSNSKSSTPVHSVSDPPKLITRQRFDSPSGSKHNVNNEKAVTPKSSKIDASSTMNSPKHEVVIPNDESFHPDVDKNIKESIEKVNEWLNKPDSSKVTSDPVFHLGPVTFKKKDANSVPSKSNATEEKIPEKQLKCKEYEPSEEVDELCKQFMERTKIRESQDDIWTKLERQLKERDELIKNGKLEKRKSRKRN